MHFKVHLVKDLEYREKEQKSLYMFIEKWKLKFSLFYWGLNKAFVEEEPVLVNLLSTKAKTKDCKEEYELNLYETSSLPLSIIGNIKRRFALAGFGLLAFGFIMGSPANADVKAKPSSFSMEKKMESKAPVIPDTALETILANTITGENMPDTKLTYYHINTQPFHTNQVWNNANPGHTNQVWNNSSPGTHTNNWNNAWSDTGHVNMPPSGFGNEYLY